MAEACRGGAIINFDNEKIAIVRLSYVGLPLAVEFGRRRPILGFDIRVDRVNEL